MKLAVSNIAWDRHDDPEILKVLKQGGATGIEVAPSKVWPGWEGATPRAARDYATMLADLGFAIPAFQAILFGIDGVAVFGLGDAGRKAFLDHLAKVAALAGACGARVLVYGAPKTRDPGDMEPERASEIALEFFAAAGRICAEHGVMLGLEANPAAYDCRFITHAMEAAELVAEVNSPGFALHVDAAQMEMEGEDPSGLATAPVRPSHIHASQPQLGDFASPHETHGRLASVLSDMDYSHWISIEMRMGDDPPGAIATALDYVRASYGKAVS